MQKSAFEVASDAFNTFKRLLTQHDAVAEFLQDNHSQFFKLYEQLLQSKNYATQRQVRPPPQPPAPRQRPEPDLMAPTSFAHISETAPASCRSILQSTGPGNAQGGCAVGCALGPGQHLLSAQRTATCSRVPVEHLLAVLCACPLGDAGWGCRCGDWIASYGRAAPAGCRRCATDDPKDPLPRHCHCIAGQPRFQTVSWDPRALAPPAAHAHEDHGSAHKCLNTVVYTTFLFFYKTAGCIRLCVRVRRCGVTVPGRVRAVAEAAGGHPHGAPERARHV